MNKYIVYGTIGFVILIVSILINPFSWNLAQERTVVETMTGKQFVRFKPGIFWSGFFSKTATWPNQLSVSYSDSTSSSEMEDNTLNVGHIQVRFSDATAASVSGIVQYILPVDEQSMLALHNAHRTPEALVMKRLNPYTREALQSSAQLLTAEIHYSGGRAQMTQNYLDQLQNGSFLIETVDTVVYDSLEHERKRIYSNKIKENADGSPARKFSSIKEYGITVADASITEVDYEDRVDHTLAKKTQAAAEASIAKQNLITAQQQALTAKAQGEQKLVEIEYQTKQDQTKQVVEAETRTKLANQDKEREAIAYQAALLEAQKIKALADAYAYEKQKIMQADGALSARLATYEKVQLGWADALKNYPGQIVPNTVLGGTSGTSNGFSNFMEIVSAKMALDLGISNKITNK